MFLYSKTDGSSISYTFLAPQNFAFARVLPQDTVDPFYVDKELRHQTLLHHFVRKRITKEELSKLTGQLVMADGKPSTITRTASTDSIPLISMQLN